MLRSSYSLVKVTYFNYQLGKCAHLENFEIPASQLCDLAMMNCYNFNWTVGTSVAGVHSSSTGLSSVDGASRDVLVHSMEVTRLVMQ